MDTRQKSEIACLKVQLRATELGAVVSKPTTEVRYDLIVDLGGKLDRVQVKYAGGRTPGASGSVSVALRTYTGNKNKFKTYQDGEVDYLLIYIPKVDRIVKLLPPLFVGKPSISIRLEPTRSGQRKGLTLAADHYW
jgi:hypothetical protein